MRERVHRAGGFESQFIKEKRWMTANPPRALPMNTADPSPKPTRLFVASIIAIAAMSFGFVIRAFLLNEWRVTFNLSESQLGSIQGAGLFPQALTIIDRKSTRLNSSHRP